MTIPGHTDSSAHETKIDIGYCQPADRVTTCLCTVINCDLFPTIPNENLANFFFSLSLSLTCHPCRNRFPPNAQVGPRPYQPRSCASSRGGGGWDSQYTSRLPSQAAKKKCPLQFQPINQTIDRSIYQSSSFAIQKQRERTS